MNERAIDEWEREYPCMHAFEEKRYFRVGGRIKIELFTLLAAAALAKKSFKDFLERLVREVRQSD